MNDLCTDAASPNGARERILAWLADGARELTWALCSLPRERWAALPPPRLSDWPALRHARHLALRETYLTLPTVRYALGEPADSVPSMRDFEHADAAWDAVAAIESAESIVHGLSDSRFELLQRLEAAPDAAWDALLPAAIGPADPSGQARPVQLDWWLLATRQHELEHLAALWKLALYWDRVSPDPVSRGFQPEQAAGLPLHPADRLEESH